MPNKFCAICGKSLPENNPHFGFCLDCYLSENPLFELPKNFSFNICFDCGSYSKKEIWSEPSENEIQCIISETLQQYLLNPISKKNKINFSIFFDKESYIFSSKDLLKKTLTVRSLYLYEHGYAPKEWQRQWREFR